MNTNKLSGVKFLLMGFFTIYYVAVFARFGQKFAAAVILSLCTAAIIALLSTYFSSANSKTSKFPWVFFATFPLFYPLSLPLHLVPFILVVSHLITITAFGGYTNHIFNPVVVAVIFMLLGYGNNAHISPSCPMPAATGFTTWSAGVPSTQPCAKIYSQLPLNRALKSAFNPIYPAIPGASMGGYLMSMGIFMALFLERGRTWLFTTLISLAAFTFLFYFWNNETGLFIFPLLFGPIPPLVLIHMCDESLDSQPILEQAIGGLMFASFALFTYIRSSDIYHIVYAFLLMQVLTPLVADVFQLFFKSKEEIKETVITNPVIEEIVHEN